MTTDHETRLLNSISREALWETNRTIAGWTRNSGTAEERAAFAYVQETLDGYGMDTHLLEHPALISYPLKASLATIGGDGQAGHVFDCLGTAFSRSVENLEAELVDVGYGTPQEVENQDGENRDGAGKIWLINGLATPGAVYAAEQAGAVGQIFINDDHRHYMIVSTIWGTPTPSSAERIPTTPSVSVTQADGHALRDLAAAGEVRVRLSSEVFMEWQQTPILIAELEGREGDDFVLFSGHLDAWEVGAMDNGSANATMMEVGRLLAQEKEQLYRGLRLAFWSGHSHGRYSGSTWYVDNHWEELYDHCVTHVNVDSTGARGATYYGNFPAHLELGDFGAQVVETQTGQPSTPRHMSRAGDMSFNGVGIPALFMSLSQVPFDAEADTDYVSQALGKLFGGRMPWWWHTGGDTIDKVDLDVLALDTQVYVSVVWRLCSVPLLPMNFQPVVTDILETLADLQSMAGDALDLSVLIERADRLAMDVRDLAGRCDSAEAGQSDAEIRAINRQIKGLSRLLIPLTYTEIGAFDHDPAWTIPHLPGLQGASDLAHLEPQSDEFHFLRTQLVRNRNQVAFVIRQAIDLLGGDGGL
jgi:hypothetical protein